MCQHLANLTKMAIWSQISYLDQFQHPSSMAKLVGKLELSPPHKYEEILAIHLWYSLRFFGFNFRTSSQRVAKF
jgi:hypothetical protein